MGVCFAIIYIIMVLWSSFSLADSSGHKARVTAVRFDSRGQRLAIGRDDGSVSVWDRAMRKTIWTSGAMGSIHSLFFRNNDEQLIAIEHFGNIRVYEARSGKSLKVIKPFPSSDEMLQAVALDPTGTVLALAGHLFSSITLIDLKLAIARGRTGGAGIGSLFFQETPGYEGVTDVCFCSSGKYIATTTNSGFLVVWKIDSLKGESKGQTILGKLVPYIRRVGSSSSLARALLGLGCSETGLLMTVGYHSKYGEIQLWKTELGEMLDCVKGAHTVVPKRVAIDKTGQFAVTTGVLSYIIWRIKDGKLHRLGKIGFRDFVDYLPNAVDFLPKEDIVAFGVNADIFLVARSTLSIVDRIGSPERQPRIERLSHKG